MENAKEVTREVLMDDIVTGILYYMPKDEFLYSPFQICNFLNRKREKYPKLIKEAYLETVTQIFSNLGAVDAIELCSSDFNRQRKTAELKGYFEEFSKSKFTSQQLGELEQIAKEFSEQFFL